VKRHLRIPHKEEFLVTISPTNKWVWCLELKGSSYASYDDEHETLILDTSSRSDALTLANAMAILLDYNLPYQGSRSRVMPTVIRNALQMAVSER